MASASFRPAVGGAAGFAGGAAGGAAAGDGAAGGAGGRGVGPAAAAAAAARAARTPLPDASRAPAVRYSTAPVHNSTKRLRSVSSGGSGMMVKTSRAVSVPSMRDITKPSFGVRATFWKRSCGLSEATRTRSRSPSTWLTTDGSWTRRAVFRIIFTVESLDAAVSPSSVPVSSNA